METNKSEWLNWMKAFMVAFLIAAFVRSFIFTSYEVQGESMTPSVYDGDRFIVNKLKLTFTELERFDLIVFHANEENDYIKRVIGLPGDTIYYIDDTLYINHEPVDEPFLEERMDEYEGERYTNNFAIAEEVPEGHIFVLGDNRPNSLDSRRLGFISTDEIVGLVDLRFWPLSDVGTVK